MKKRKMADQTVYNYQSIGTVPLLTPVIAVVGLRLPLIF